MTGDAPVLLENLIVRGYQDRLALIFTHFEDVTAPDLDFAGRREKVLEGLSNAIQSIASLPKAERVRLEQTAGSKTHLFARLDLQVIKHKLTQSELKKLCDLFRRGGKQLSPGIDPDTTSIRLQMSCESRLQPIERSGARRSSHFSIGRSWRR
jgi:hypothetical protein